MRPPLPQATTPRQRMVGKLPPGYFEDGPKERPKETAPKPANGYPPATAWFWAKGDELCGNSLFVGVAGGNYPKAQEIEACKWPVTREAGDEVFLRQIRPWQAQAVNPASGVTIFWKSITYPVVSVKNGTESTQNG